MITYVLSREASLRVKHCLTLLLLLDIFIVLFRPLQNLTPIEVPEEELRGVILSREMTPPDGRKIEFQKMKSSHFGRMKVMGG